MKEGFKMFKIFKKKSSNNISLFSPAEGELIPITAVSDKVFSGKLLGDGYAVIPTDGEIYSPIKGEIVSIFPSKHAITLKNTVGLEVILHMGVDTVDLKGIPFEISVKEGQKVKQTTKLASINLKYLKENKKSNEIIVALTNLAELSGEISSISKKNVEASSLIGTIEILSL